MAARFTPLAASLLDTTDIETTVATVLRAAPRMIGGVEMASMTTVTGGGRFRTPVRTDPTATRADEAQYQAGAGPCLDAVRTGGTGLARCDDLAAAGRPWPEFAAAAVRLGIRGVLSEKWALDNGLIPSPEKT